MAPEQTVEGNWPDPPDNEEQFMTDLRAFHEQRGTPFDERPRVNNKPINLFALFKDIVGRGGYDKVSSEKLLWRKIGQEYNVGQTNAAAYAFALKTIYYRNLAAYAIKRVHKQDPPPKEILEQTTAKGADLLNRTVDNFRAATRDGFENGQTSDVSEDEKTPKVDRMDVDDPGSLGRSTRGLRQAPQQRVLYQPDLTSTRQTRPVSNQAQSPQPLVNQQNWSQANNPAMNPNSSSFNVMGYVPQQPIPLTLRPVPTPMSNPAAHKEKAKRLHDVKLAKAGLLHAKSQIMQPGTGFDGPNIYVRTLLALRSGVAEEVDWALHHLVKISHERGDKYRFEAFPGLAEGLIEKVLGVSSLFYEIEWTINYDEHAVDPGVEILNGQDGTPDILERISQLKQREIPQDVVTGDFSHKLSKDTEACLVIRNMSMLDDNARYLSEMQPLRDLLSIILSLPNKDYLDELKHYALDISEQLTKYWIVKETDPLYVSLLDIVGVTLDRGAALSAMRAISRISIELGVANTLKNVPIPTVIKVLEWTMLDDEELVGACLDAFYQFTAVPENVAHLLVCVEEGKINLESAFKQLGVLLLYRAMPVSERRLIAPAIPARTTSNIQDAPQALMNDIVMTPEPERSSAWLRSLFEENPESDITQIALWQSYQAKFTPLSTPERPLLPAADFIKNVSTTFPSAKAEVIPGPQPRFIIKGIRPRLIPRDTKGRPYQRCLWFPPNSHRSCGTFHSSPAAVWDHIVTQHLGVTRSLEGNKQWDFSSVREKATAQSKPLFCHWARCKHFAPNGVYDPVVVGIHVRTHLSDTSDAAQHRAKYNSTRRPGVNGYGHSLPEDEDDFNGYPAEWEQFWWRDTEIDHRGGPMGLSYTSVLVLRSLARNIPKAMTTTQAEKLRLTKSGGRDGWMQRLFGPLMERLVHVAAINRTLSGNILELKNFIEKQLEDDE